MCTPGPGAQRSQATASTTSRLSQLVPSRLTARAAPESCRAGRFTTVPGTRKALSLVGKGPYLRKLVAGAVVSLAVSHRSPGPWRLCYTRCYTDEQTYQQQTSMSRSPMPVVTPGSASVRPSLRYRQCIPNWHSCAATGKGTGLFECARRQDLSLNTGQALRPRKTVRAAAARPALVDAYRDHLRKHHAEDPAAPVRPHQFGTEAPGAPQPTDRHRAGRLARTRRPANPAVRCAT
jgi:hypothetical protein